mmetsp:Transcript_20466/g.59779  ORF Transcript_20466/g.59779 Transcript_20466/m.59779 type:complete len:317 (+) Transcript_20466:30-980(+)
MEDMGGSLRTLLTRVAKRDLTDTEITTVSGAVSGVAATFAKQPIQRMKWIRQVHEGQPIPYSRIAQETMAKQGLRGFFAGSMAAIYRNVPHSIMAYSLYPHCEAVVFGLERRADPRRKDPSASFSTRFWAGYATLFLTTIVTHPLDTIRVRLSVFPETKGVFRASQDMWRHEGVSAFYRGFTATLLGAGPRGALGFGIFETMKPACRNMPFLKDHDALSKLLCGYLAGFGSEFFIYPLDTVRRRQQALGDSTCIGRANAFRAVHHIWRTEGLRGMYKGILLNLFKNPVATAVSFTVNDSVKEAFGYGKERRFQSAR